MSRKPTPRTDSMTTFNTADGNKTSDEAQDYDRNVLLCPFCAPLSLCEWLQQRCGDLDHYIEFHIDEDASLKMRIDWRAQATYSVHSMTQGNNGRTEIVDSGICREFKEERPLAAPQAADIKVVVTEARNNVVNEIPAVVTVNGPINQGDHLKFESVVDGIKNSLMRSNSPASPVSTCLT